MAFGETRLQTVRPEEVLLAPDASGRLAREITFAAQNLDEIDAALADHVNGDMTVQVNELLDSRRQIACEQQAARAIYEVMNFGEYEEEVA
ncbi:hypothetical protein GII36_00475 [Candidatus Mycosynbacter amalyticus]|uniref:Uncharacterized protein n=1 Tax=Candidatus Mycosynbacter amalyticus TaxID=2665156 RepID=A0A857MIF6_9BACT|nr:hypothetical protein [Candidatus Mycosynbacter amalyticus]QHN42333.1 hypothetical protein GII36_00475 [Candidatus Mycosynbacter amalyticus]